MTSMPLNVMHADEQRFGPEYAECTKCPLESACEAKKFVTADVGEAYRPGGLMVIGEGPGRTEVSQGRPFVGPPGRLLDTLLAQAGVPREAVWVTHATLCQPPLKDDKTKSKLLESAVYACIPRLEVEISAARPRVIIALGQYAMMAATGFETQKTRLVPQTCDHCDADRKIGPVLRCALGDCDWFVRLPEGDDGSATKAAHNHVCPKCGSSIKRLRPRRIKCPVCDGRKMREESYTIFSNTYQLTGRNGVAGAVFHADQLPSRFDEIGGTRYIIPTYHPSFCLQPIKKTDLGGAQKRIGGQYAGHASYLHIKKAVELLRRDAKFSARPLATRNPEIVRKFLSRPGTYAVDIETNSKGGAWVQPVFDDKGNVKDALRITCIGFARADDEQALVVDTRDYVNLAYKNWCAGDPLLDAIHAFFVDETKAKVFHNGIFDRTVIRRIWGMDVLGEIHDTMLQHTNCYPDEEHGLGFVAHELLDMPAWKDTGPSMAEGRFYLNSGYRTFDELAQYNALDTRATILIDEKMRGADSAHGVLAVDGSHEVYRLDMRMVDIAFEMQWVGLPLSAELRRAAGDDFLRKEEESLAALREIVRRDDWTPAGNDLLWALYDPAGPCGFVPPSYTDTGAPTTKKTELQKLGDHPFIQHLLQYRKNNYYRTHYVESSAFVVAEDGRIHPEWKPWGARTGRWSSTPNFQNWPKDLRKMVVAPPGRVFVGADYSQLEMRIMAALSGDPELIRRCAEADESDKLNPDKDPHSFVASMVFGSTFVDASKAAASDKTANTKAKLLRDIVKRTVYGLNYGSGAQTVLRAIYDGGYEGPPITIRTIETVTKTYFSLFPKVVTWREHVLREAAEQKAIYSPVMKRHRIFPFGDIDATVAYNYPIQSGAADIMNLRLVALVDALPTVDPSAAVVAQVHDAVYVECDETRANDVARCVEDTLTVEWSLAAGAPKMPFVASASIAKNWKDAA